jgi:hypothetical protein
MALRAPTAEVTAAGARQEATAVVEALRTTIAAIAAPARVTAATAAGHHTVVDHHMAGHRTVVGHRTVADRHTVAAAMDGKLALDSLQRGSRRTIILLP